MPPEGLHLKSATTFTGGRTPFQAISEPIAEPNLSRASMVRVLTCGSVDDGKSTLIGRLLWDAADLPDDTRLAVMATAGADGVPDVSLLLDGLEAERAQGITIDVAWRYFDIDARRYVVIDCPGHEQYTRNMATGASQADIAIMLVDARQGIKLQTRRHAAILELVGIRTVILAVNKMDRVEWSQARFSKISAEFADIAARSGFESAVAIPIAARFGDNVAHASTRMAWFAGPTLRTALGRQAGRQRRDDKPFRFPVQMVLRDGKDFRGLAGTIAAGRIARGDCVVDMLSGRRARVSRIATFDGDRDSAHAGQPVAIELDADLDIARGAMLADPDRPASLANDIEARIVWLADAALGRRGLLLRTATDLVPVSSLNVVSRLDLESLERQPSLVCGANDIAEVRISLGRSTALDVFGTHRGSGQFVLVDALDGATVAGGVVTSMTSSGPAGQYNVFRLSRALLAATVCADLPSTDEARHEFRRRASEVAFLMRAAGVNVDLEDFANGTSTAQEQDI